MDVEPVGETRESTSHRRNQTACEACRATKIRCQPSEQPGVCRKCLESKRECVSRTGPRIRRPRRAKTAPDGAPPQAAPPPPNVPSSTFSIDFAVPTQGEVDEYFETLRETHEQMVDNALPPVDDASASALASSSSNFPTPPASSSTPSHSIESLHAKPQFNLSSAETLLTAFKSMLPFYPCITISDDTTVPQLAATRPFVLLAILAAASGSRTLQGHSLYDEEFRKVLALKFVAGGERTLELLQGILIYCAWYPFHLRPKNKQVFHYIRMAGDLIHDLDLDQEPSGGFFLGSEPLGHQLNGIRAYLSYCYFVGAFVVGWRRYSNNLASSFPATGWTAMCCDILENNAQVTGDTVLSILVRIASINRDVAETIYERRDKPEQQSRLLLLGLETQARELQQRIPPHIAATTPMRLALLFIEFYPNAGGLLCAPRPRDPSAFSAPLRPTAPKLASVVPALRLFLSESLRLDPPTFSCFTAVDWGRLILAIILSFRLSLHVPECPAFDHVAARADIRLDTFLDTMCREPDCLVPAANKIDVLSASRVVMRVVKAKLDRRLELDSMREVARGSCPMLDGSLDQFFPLWDVGLATLNTTTGPTEMGAAAGGGKQPVFHDLWATMTMGWANEDDEGGT